MFSTPEIRDKVGGYLRELGLSHEVVGDTVWLIRDPERGLAQVVVYADETLVTIRARLIDIPTDGREAFFEDLLRLNLEMLHGAYALEEEAVIWMDTLELGTMDLEEFQASLDAASLCMLQHVPRLSNQISGGDNGSI